MTSTIPQITPHPWILAKPIEDTQALASRAKMYSTLSKVSLAAIAAIAVSIFAISLAASVTSGALPFILLGLVLATPAFAVGASKCQDKGKLIEHDLSTMRATLHHFQQIQHWKEPDILAFFATHHIQAPTHISLPRLLPLIARFLAKSTSAEENKARSERMLIAEGIEDRTIRLDLRRMGWQILEERAIPDALEAAFILHLLAKPHLQHLPSDVYSCTPKSFDERMFDRIYGPNEPYLEMQDHAVMLEDLRKDFSIDALHKDFFHDH